jgi:hypothetical protein
MEHTSTLEQGTIPNIRERRRKAKGNHAYLQKRCCYQNNKSNVRGESKCDVETIDNVLI